MRKHAYLIMAHNEPEVLKRLVCLLDDARNDLYIHIDKKCNQINISELKKSIKQAGCFLIKRKSISWGGYSQVDCELRLLKTAVLREGYAYYHLLSGQDFPLKTQNEIHSFFEENEGKNYITIVPDPEGQPKQFGDRVCYYRIFQDVVGRKHTGLKYLLHRVENFLVKVQRRMSINRMKKWEVDLRKGDNWFSIHREMAEYILNHEKWIRKNFKYTLCADEIFIQTLAYHSPLKETIVNNDLRLIDWKRGGPYVFTMADWEMLTASKDLFCRKVSWEKDRLLVEKLYDYLLKRRDS